MNKSLKSLKSLSIHILFFFLLISNASSFKTKLISKTTQGSPILLNQKTKVIIQGPYAEIEYIQTYNNPFHQALEAQFYFPRPENSVFHRFEAIFSNHTVISKIFEKTKAQEFISRRKNAVALSHRSSLMSETMSVNIGMIEAHESVEIRFSFIQPLDVIFNEFWSFTLSYPSTESDNPWKVEVEIKSDQPFRKIRNPSHNIEPEFFETNSKLYTAVWNATIVSNKDFIVYFRSFQIESPSTLLATHPNYPDDHVLLISSILQLFKSLNPIRVQQFLEKEEEEGLLKLKNQVFQEDFQNAKAEFIFLIDCSFSMSGEKIDNLRKTLDKFLTMLPKNSFFNIISFGSSYTFYGRESLQSSPQNIWKAKVWINLIDADMEGTEVLSALQQAIHAPLIQGYSRTVILLSDGIGFEPEKVINYVKENADYAKVCGLKIEEETSKFLMKKIGKAGRCWDELMLKEKDVEDKESFLIRAAISPSLENITYDIKCWNSQEEVVFTDESRQSGLFRNEPLKKWFYFVNIPDIESCNVTISYINRFTKEKTTQELKIDGFKSAEVSAAWHKVAYKSKIDKLLESRAVWNSHFTDRKIVELSTRYQIFSDYVSFLAVREENIVNLQEIPKVISADFLSLSTQAENRQNAEIDHLSLKTPDDRSELGDMIKILKSKNFEQPIQIMECFYIGLWVFFIYRHLSRKYKTKEGSRKENYDEIIRRLTHQTNQ